MKDKIDFVITWVDGNDSVWRKEKEKYSGIKDDAVRYRDWENLQYWFRGVEKFAPWVNHIYFVTYGHIPKWLNTKNPKLTVVNHKDFIPIEYLPTFNSRVIELHLHKIKDLSEKFVYFNDDMFILKHVKPVDFYNKEKPRDIGAIQPIIYNGQENTYAHMRLNNTRIINNYFNPRKMLKKNIIKWINFRYPLYSIKNLCMFATVSKYPGFIIPHVPTSHLKSTFETVWKNENEILNRTSAHKFRDNSDVNHFLMQYWQLASGNFYPRSIKVGKYISISNDNKKLIELILKQKYKLICLNDVDNNIDFNKAKNEIKKAFEQILPDKSTFER